MTSNQLFFRRVKENWKHQYRVWKLAVDWIVYVYVVLPFSAAGLFIYISWWRHQPDWFAWLPIPLIILLQFFIMIPGGIRSFYETGDQLFLMQKKRWMKRLALNGLVYSLLFQCVQTAAGFAICLPLLVLYQHMSWIEVTGWVLFTYVFSIMMSIVDVYRSMTFHGWKSMVTLPLQWFAACAAYSYAVLLLLHQLQWSIAMDVLLMALFVWLVRKKLNMTGTFLFDAERDRKYKMRFTGLMVGNYLDKKPVFERRRTFLFSRSGHIFRKRTPVNSLAEVHIKALLRSSSKAWYYLRFVIIGSGAAAAVPSGIKWIVLTGVSLLLCYWLKSCVKDVNGASFVQLFPWGDMTPMSAMRKSVWVLSAPCIMLLSIIIGLQLYPWWSVIPMLLIGVGVSRAASGILCIW